MFPARGRSLMRKTAVEGWQGCSLGGLEAEGVHRHPLTRAIVATSASCLGLPTRNVASVRLDRPHASRAGQDVPGVSRRILASPGRSGLRPLASAPNGATVYSPFGAPVEHHRRREDRRGGKQDEAMSSRRGLMVYEKGRAPDPLRPIFGNEKGKMA